MIFIWYLVAAAPLLSSATIYHCNANETCNINCTGIVNISNLVPTQCTNLTIYALSASSVTVSCANNSYCDNMTVYAPSCDDKCNEYELTCIVNCVGDDNVCNNIQIYTNKTVALLKCAVSADKYGNACSNGKIYGLQGPGTTYFLCRNNTQCNSITIHNFDTTSITMSNEGIINDLNITAPYAKQIIFNSIFIGHIYNNCHIENTFGQLQTVIGTTSFINSEFYLGAELSYHNWNGADFHNNKIHCLSGLTATFGGSVRIYNNIFFVENSSIDMTIEQNVRFDSNDIFANYSKDFYVYMAGINASISNNNIYAQYAKNIDFVVEDLRDNINGNNFYVSNAENVTFNIYGQFFENKIHGAHIKEFALLCLFDRAVCGSNKDEYILSNAQSVLLQAGGGSGGAGGTIDGGYFDVTNVSNLNIFSYFGFIQNININAKFAGNINVTMYSGQLYNSTIDASMSKSLDIWCKSWGYWYDIKNTNCNQLTLRIPPPFDGMNKHNTSLLCDGLGCENMILYTVNGAKDINITGVNCNCDSLFSNVNCIDEWEIYCNDNRKPSILSSVKKCEGICCDDVVKELNFEDLSHCSSGNDNNGMMGVYIAVIFISVTIVVVIGVWVTVKCHTKKKNEKEEVLLAQN